MKKQSYKRTYHPLIILFYASGMLDNSELKQLPKTTKHNWNKFKHENYYGYEIALPYIEQFDEIKEVFASRFARKTLKFLLKTRKVYYNMLQEFSSNKKLLKLNSKHFVESIDTIALFANVNKQTACKFFGISKDWYYNQKKKLVCELSKLKLCYKQQPNQLTYDEVIAIERVVMNPKNYGKPKITMYYECLRNNAVSCSVSTFNKYALAVGHKNPKRFKPKPKKGLRASRVFEWLHVDITNIQTLESGVQKVAFIKDNFSRAILHYGSTNKKAGSEFIKSLFEETFEKYNLYENQKSINILSDGGSENKGELLSWIKNIKAPPQVYKITAQTAEFPFSNSMSESTHRIYKTEFLNGTFSLNKKSHLKSLETFVDYYNYKRFPTKLYGFSPMEVLKGKIPDKKHFKLQIEIARQNRIAENRQFNCISKIGCH